MKNLQASVCASIWAAEEGAIMGDDIAEDGLTYQALVAKAPYNMADLVKSAKELSALIKDMYDPMALSNFELPLLPTMGFKPARDVPVPLDACRRTAVIIKTPSPPVTGNRHARRAALSRKNRHA
jgi:hypothetical protein